MLKALYFEFPWGSEREIFMLVKCCLGLDHIFGRIVEFDVLSGKVRVECFVLITTIGI
jgi:hypothetical protein